MTALPPAEPDHLPAGDADVTGATRRIPATPGPAVQGHEP